MKRVLSFALALMMVLSLSACGGKGKDNSKDNDKKDTPEITMTAKEVLDSLKKSLGDSYTSDSAEAEDRLSGYYGLDMSKIESWAAESNSNNSINMDCTVVLKVKEGYDQDAAALLQEGFDQMCSYARMYNMDLQRVLQARLFVSGNYVALLIEGKQGDWEASEEDQAKFAADEAAKVDAAWNSIFGSAKNIIVIPEDKGENGDNSGGGIIVPDEDDPQNSDHQGTDDTKKDDNSSKKDDTSKDSKKDNNSDKKDNTNKDGKKDDNSGKQDNAEMKASEVLNKLKKSLGGSYTSDSAEAESRLSGYYGLDVSKIESWAAESNSNNSMNMDCAVILKVKDGYAQSAAASLQKGFEQMCSYARMYHIDLQRVLQARLFVNCNYVALLIEGKQGDWQASEEDQAKFAADEAAKVDAAWNSIFGSAKNTIVIPKDDGGNNDNSGGGLIVPDDLDSGWTE